MLMRGDNSLSRFSWAPSHIDMEGNEGAEKEVEEGRAQHPLHSLRQQSPHLSYVNVQIVETAQAMLALAAPLEASMREEGW